jgi:hypothetical protein
MSYDCRFTDWSSIAQDIPFLGLKSPPVPVSPVILQDCQFCPNDRIMRLI